MKEITINVARIINSVTLNYNNNLCTLKPFVNILRDLLGYDAIKELLLYNDIQEEDSEFKASPYSEEDVYKLLFIMSRNLGNEFIQFMNLLSKSLSEE